MVKDTEFYDRASERYSAERYPDRARSYTQFFFKRRLAAVVELIGQATSEADRNLSVLEIGCADGIVLRKIHDVFGSRFSHFLGIDVSPKMIESAVRKNRGTTIAFKTREEYGAATHDLVVEVGVVNYVPDAENEMRYARNALKDSGRYVCSVAGTDSFWNKVKPGDKGFLNFHSFSAYERMLAKFFVIERKMPVGFFVPLLWRVPAVARVIQPIVEAILRPFVPRAFHEQVYLLRAK